VALFLTLHGVFLAFTLDFAECPVCAKISLVNTFVKDPITWTPNEKKSEQPGSLLTIEELEKKRIEDSKYEHS
jgi:hypothetical protein